MTHVVDPEKLVAFSAGVLERVGFPDNEARLSAEILTRNSLRGVFSHGIWMLPEYVKWIEGGAVKPGAPVDIVRDRGGVVTVDGNAGFGVLVAHRATELAIERAKQHGTSSVAVRNSNHFAAAGHFGLMCAEAGVIGVVSSNGAPGMTLAGTAEAVVCTQPLAYGVPNAPGDSPIVLDMALSWVAGRKVFMAAEKGESIPDHWIVDKDGNPTTDPNDFAAGGAMQVMAGHKGSGLAVLVELLSGVLSGAAITKQGGNPMRDPSDSCRTGHHIIAMDVEAFIDLPEYYDRVKHFVSEVRTARRAPGVDRIYLPGEIEHEKEQAARRDGLYLDEPIWNALADLADRYDRLEEFEQLAR